MKSKKSFQVFGLGSVGLFLATQLINNHQRVLGFDPRMWVKSEDQIAQERAAMQQQAIQQQASQAAANGVINTATQAAQQDLQQNGGQGIAAMAQQLGIQL
mgnify:CR=1 FL=1